MRRLNRTIALVTVVALTNAGCVAMMREPHQELKVHSNPSDANVQIDGFNAGRTPLRTVVQRSNHVIRLEKEGYEPAQQMIGTRVSGAAIGWTIAGVLLWGVFELISLTSIEKYPNLDPDEVTVTLRPMGGQAVGVPK